MPHYADIAAPLTNSGKLFPKKLKWEEQHQAASSSLKEYLKDDMVVMGPDYSKPFLLQTDASEVGIGAVLSQLDEQKQDRVVAYFSRKLKRAERNYATVERECLAIMDGIKYFEVYLTGVPVKDHGCLKYLHNMKDSGGRLMRWVIRLQPYDYKITHRPGKDNGNADGLSRQAWEEDVGPDALHGEKGGVLEIFQPRRAPTRETEQGWRSSNPEELQQQ